MSNTSACLSGGRDGQRCDGIDRSSTIEGAVSSLRDSISSQQLIEINKTAAEYQKRGDYVHAVAAYLLLFEKAKQNNTTILSYACVTATAPLHTCS